MKDLEQTLSALQNDRQRVEAEIAGANETMRQAQQTLGDAGGRRAQLAGQIAPVQRLLDDLTRSRAAVAAQREAASREFEIAEILESGLLAQADRELPEARRAALQTAIEGVDAPIGDLKQQVRTLQDRRAETQAALDAAQQRAVAREAGIRVAIAQLGHLSEQIQAARQQVARVSAQANAAVAAGRMGEAFYLAGELERALEQLSPWLRPEAESELIDRLDEQWREAQAAKTTAVEQSAALDQIVQELAAVESELQRRLQSREAAIRTALATEEAVEPAAETGRARRAGQITRGAGR